MAEASIDIPNKVSQFAKKMPGTFFYRTEAYIIIFFVLLIPCIYFNFTIRNIPKYVEEQSEPNPTKNTIINFEHKDLSLKIYDNLAISETHRNFNLNENPFIDFTFGKFYIRSYQNQVYDNQPEILGTQQKSTLNMVVFFDFGYDMLEQRICKIQAHERNSIFFIAIFASLIALTTLINAHICRPRVLDVLNNKSIYEDIKKKCENWVSEPSPQGLENLALKYLTYINKLQKSAKDLLKQSEKLLYSFNLFIIGLWSGFILLYIITYTIKISINATAFLFVITYLVYVFHLLRYYKDSRYHVESIITEIDKLSTEIPDELSLFPKWENNNKTLLTNISPINTNTHSEG